MRKQKRKTYYPTISWSSSRFEKAWKSCNSTHNAGGDDEVSSLDVAQSLCHGLRLGSCAIEARLRSPDGDALESLWREFHNVQLEVGPHAETVELDVSRQALVSHLHTRTHGVS